MSQHPSHPALIKRPNDAGAPEQILHQGHWLSLKCRGRWEYVERNTPAGAVVIVAMTPRQQVLFVEQYRVPIGAATIEMPAGLIGDLPGATEENVFDSARRELEEETGYAATHFELLAAGPSSAGMSTEIIHFVRARELRKVGPGGGDATENIVVHEIPLKAAAQWLQERQSQGIPIDPKLYAGLWWLQQDESADY